MKKTKRQIENEYIASVRSARVAHNIACDTAAEVFASAFRAVRRKRNRELYSLSSKRKDNDT